MKTNTSKIVKYSKDGNVLGCGKNFVHWWCGALFADGHRLLCRNCNKLKFTLLKTKNKKQKHDK